MTSIENVIGDSSLPQRTGALEQDMNTVKYRLDVLEAERLPTRVTQLEGVAESTRETLMSLRETSTETAKQVHAMRMEVNVDLNEVNIGISDKIDNIHTRVTTLETKLGLYLAGAVVTMTFFGWVLDSPLVRGIITR